MSKNCMPQKFWKRTCLLVCVIALAACTAIHTPPAYMPSRDGIQAGQSITVQGNENIYGVARAHNVSMRELIVLNNLKPPFEIRPGQTLILPASGGASSFAGDMPPPTAAPLTPVDKNDLSPLAPQGVSSEALAPIAPPAPPQFNLSAPPAATGAPQFMVAPQPLPPPQAAPPAPASSSAQVTSQTDLVQSLNHPAPSSRQVATTTTPSSAVSAAPSAAAAAGDSTVSMIWPVQGPLLSSFGSKGPGLNNDGVNIGAPKGTSVMAAASGTVVYAGDEMKGFGNLVLIRHEGNWVTAYAHLDRVLVKKDSIVAQGDMIGTVGKTGNVATPQLHFETRLDGKPVDPSGVIKTSP